MYIFSWYVREDIEIFMPVNVWSDTGDWISAVSRWRRSEIFEEVPVVAPANVSSITGVIRSGFMEGLADEKSFPSSDYRHSNPGLYESPRKSWKAGASHRRMSASIKNRPGVVCLSVFGPDVPARENARTILDPRFRTCCGNKISLY